MTISRRQYVRRSVADVRRLAEELLIAAGCSPDSAKVAADVFTEAELRGISLQGLDYLPYMIEGLQTGRINPNAQPLLTRESEAVALVDAGGGVGQLAANFAVDLAIKKASKAGACVVGLVDASELYMLGYYVERIARAKMVGIAFTTSYPLVHPWGGSEPLLGTNPIAMAFPRKDAAPVLIDLATSALAYGRLRQAAYYDEEVEAGAGIDADGHPTVRAREIQGGALSPLGGPKGYALSLAVSLFCGAFIGGDVGRQLQSFTEETNSRARLGHLFIVFDPEHTVGYEAMTASVERHLEEIKSSAIAPGFSEIRIPGERAFRQRESSERGEIAILEVTWEKLEEISANFRRARSGHRV